MSAVAAARETDMPRSCNSASRVSTRPSTQPGFVVIGCLPLGLAVQQQVHRVGPGRRAAVYADEHQIGRCRGGCPHRGGPVADRVERPAGRASV